MAHPIRTSFWLQQQNSSLAVTFGLPGAFTALQPESLKVTLTDFFHHVNSITALREAWSCSSCTSRCLQTFSLVKRGSWKPPRRQVPAQMSFPSTEYLCTSGRATCESRQRWVFREFLVFDMMAGSSIWNTSSHLLPEIKWSWWSVTKSLHVSIAKCFGKLCFSVGYLISVVILNTIHINSLTHWTAATEPYWLSEHQPTESIPSINMDLNGGQLHPTTLDNSFFSPIFYSANQIFFL